MKRSEMRSLIEQKLTNLIENYNAHTYLIDEADDILKMIEDVGIKPPTWICTKSLFPGDISETEMDCWEEDYYGF